MCLRAIPCVKVVFVAYRMMKMSGQRRGCKTYCWYRMHTLPPIWPCNHKVNESSILPNIFETCDKHTPLCLCHCHDQHPISIEISCWKPLVVANIVPSRWFPRRNLDWRYFVGCTRLITISDRKEQMEKTEFWFMSVVPVFMWRKLLLLLKIPESYFQY